MRIILRDCLSHTQEKIQKNIYFRLNVYSVEMELECIAVYSCYVVSMFTDVDALSSRTSPVSQSVFKHLPVST